MTIQSDLPDLQPPMPLSYSRLATYKRCPKQYEFAYVKKITRAISAGESYGSSLHNTLKRWGEIELSHQEVQEPSQLTLFADDRPTYKTPLDIHTLLTLWRGCFIAQGYASQQEMDAHVLRGEQALRHFFLWWSREKREVLAIEKSFKWDMLQSSEEASNTNAMPLDTVISGRFDRIERCPGGLRIIDFKSSKPRSQVDIDADVQLSIYAQCAKQLWNEEVSELILLFLGEEECREACTTRNTSQLKDAATSIVHIARRIAEQDYQATPSVEKCRHCPYRDMCPSRGR